MICARRRRGAAERRGHRRRDARRIPAAFSAVFSTFYLFESLLGLTAEELDEQAREYLRRLRLERKVRVTGGALPT